MGNYVSVTYATTYIGTNPKVGAIWTAYSTAQKNAWIDLAEQKIENISWLGEHTGTGDPNLKFPRIFLEAAEDYSRYETVDQQILDRLDANEGIIPEDLKKAICETIIQWIQLLGFQKLQDLQDVNVKSFSAGSVSFNFEGNKGKYPLPKPAWELVYYMSLLWWRMPDAQQVRRI